MTVRLNSMTPRRLLAALVACLFVAAAACGEGSGGANGGGKGDAPSVNIHEFGTPEEIGTGLLDGASQDGSAVYVEEPDPQFPEPGCEGQPESVMSRLPVEGGEREVVGGESAPLRGSLVRGGSDGRVAVVAGCESFFTDLFVAGESEDGRLTEVTRVTPAGIPEDFLLNPSSVSWNRDGDKLLAALQHQNAPDGDPAQVVTIDPQSGQVTKLFDAEQGTGVFRVGQLQNGTYVVSTNLVVTYRDEQGVVKAGFQGKDFEIAPDRKSLVIFGRNVFLGTQDETTAAEILAEEQGREISSVQFAPDGEAIVLTRYLLEGGQVEVGVASLEDRRFTSVVTGGQYGRAYFTGDGEALVFNQFGGEPDFTSKVYLTRFEAV
jgi:hypothetical protein